jgi:hypothetical protein
MCQTGSCAHRMGSIVPPVGQRPACAQVYILDGAAQVEVRRGLPWGARLDVDILSGLTDMLMAVNPFVRHFRAAAEDDAPELHLRIVVGIWLTIQGATFAPGPAMVPVCNERKLASCALGKIKCRKETELP